ncbi:hypothetical protein [Streptomyces chartreusis]|nr:hypothetical protein [Streptomyces chartreusis]QEV72823.1 hypothetical protein CP983_43475 [Streptomyces chartreusis]GGX56805.1 hypothetical protein GCM10010321_87460 [Streptomyces chartreusis]
MQVQMQERLAGLKQDFEKGEHQLHSLVQQETALKESLLRVSGAIRVLEELLSTDQEDTGGEGTAGVNEARGDGQR